MNGNPTETLAAFTAGLEHGDLPKAIRARVLGLLIDAIASAIVGRAGDEMTRFERLARKLGGSGGPCTVIGSAHRYPPVGAALLNGYQVTALNLCDVYRPAHCHMSPEVVPPALAVAEDRHVSGKELLTALAAGLEIACRLGRAINFDAFQERRWHSPGVIGPLGGAAAVGRLLNLDAVGQRNALGLAGSQSAGTMAHWGTPTIKFHQARGALSGLVAGMLAGEGFRAGDDVLADPNGGILVNYSDGGRPTALTDELGERWELELLSLKRWPSGSGLQTTVTSILALVEHHDVKPEMIDEVRIVLPSQAYRTHGPMGWDTSFTAMLSARYVTAVVLHDRRCWIDQFDTERRQDPVLDAFARDRIEIEEDPSLGSSAAVIEIRSTDGSVFRDARDLPKGDPGDPLDLEQIIEKFRDARAVMTERIAEQALDGLLDLEEADDVAPLIALVGAPTEPGAR
ncbi:MAG: MmgE/PrpD family protein [Acidimicrobiales bacterium]